MDPSAESVDALWRPNFVFKYEDLKRQLHSAISKASWDESGLNPKNRVDSLDVSTSGWRIDGATACGTQFFAIPQILLPNLAPMRIDVFLPDQGEYPQALRDSLHCNDVVPSRNSHAISEFGISLHLCRALDNWCIRNPEFLKRYIELPFGSKLVFDRVSANVNEMNLTIVPSHDIERQTVSQKALQKLWATDISDDVWPDSLDIGCLQFVKQLHDTISIVHLLQNGIAQTAIFKSNTSSLDHLYHELNFLLGNPPHPNVMPRPLFVVTKQNRFGGKKGVVGFVLPYYPPGSLRDILPFRFRNHSLSMSEKFRWSREIASALIHVNEKSKTFYSDLRPDNVLLSCKEGLNTGICSAQDSGDSVVLCDFEQRGNWHQWCSPEVLYGQYAENLRASKTLHPSDRWYGLVKSFIARTRKQAETVVQKKNRAWFSLTRESQEKAQVYSLGLFLYCVFEGLSSVGPDIANAYPIDPDICFPEFRHTPDSVRELIRHCTIDAPVWGDASIGNGFEGHDNLARRPPKKVVRTGALIHPEGHLDTTKSSDDMKKVVLDTALQWWQNELEKAEQFFGSEQWQNGQFGKDRPTLRAVLESLTEIEKRNSI